jgi:hypothetical protein
MTFIFGQERRMDYGERLPSSGKLPDEAMVKFDGEWSAVRALSDSDLLKMSQVDIASFSPLPSDQFAEVISGSLDEWRENPGRSFLSAAGNAPFARSGKKMFNSLEHQTHFLAGLCRVGGQGARNLQAVRSKEQGARFHRERGVVAITASEAGVVYVNQMARAFHVWEKRNAAMVRSGAVKLPKKLYRGVRAGELEFPDFGIERAKGQMYEEFAASLTQDRFDHLVSHGVGSMFPGNILSFTANVEVARYFANEAGFVVSVDPRDVDVVAAWSFNEELDGKDPMSNKHEREWIIRLSPDHQFAREDVEVTASEWLMVNSDIRAINLAGHGAKATYKMNGLKIESKFEYRASGEGGSVRFSVDGEWMEWTRNQFKKEKGFDPVPTSAEQVQNLQYWSYDRYGGRKPVLINKAMVQSSVLTPVV